VLSQTKRKLNVSAKPIRAGKTAVLCAVLNTKLLEQVVTLKLLKTKKIENALEF